MIHPVKGKVPNNKEKRCWADKQWQVGDGRVAGGWGTASKKLLLFLLLPSVPLATRRLLGFLFCWGSGKKEYVFDLQNRPHPHMSRVTRTYLSVMEQGWGLITGNYTVIQEQFCSLYSFDSTSKNKTEHVEGITAVGNMGQLQRRKEGRMKHRYLFTKTEIATKRNSLLHT